MGLERAIHSRRDSNTLPPLFLIAALTVVFLVVNGHRLSVEGVAEAGDTPRYVEGGNSLFDGRGLDGRQAIYSGYVAVVGASRLLGLGLSGVVALQVILSAVAAIFLFLIGRRLAGSWCGLLASALYVGNPDIARWNAYILPDSLYISMVVIAAWAIHRAPKKGRQGYAIAAAVVLLAATLRPNGWLLIPAAGIYWIWTAMRPGLPRWGATAGICAAFVLAVAAFPAKQDTTGTLQPDQLVRRGVVVYDYPSSYLEVPREPASKATGWRGFVAYAAEHPLDTARVALARMVAEALRVREFYSPAHNAFLLLWTLPIYAFAALGLAMHHSRRLVRLLLAIAVLHLLLVGVIAADYDSRYALHFLPLIGAIAAAGAVGLSQRIPTDSQATAFGPST